MYVRACAPRKGACFGRVWRNGACFGRDARKVAFSCACFARGCILVFFFLEREHVSQKGACFGRNETKGGCLGCIPQKGVSFRHDFDTIPVSCLNVLFVCVCVCVGLCVCVCVCVCVGESEQASERER